MSPKQSGNSFAVLFFGGNFDADRFLFSRRGQISNCVRIEQQGVYERTARAGLLPGSRYQSEIQPLVMDCICVGFCTPLHGRRYAGCGDAGNYRSRRDKPAARSDSDQPANRLASVLQPVSTPDRDCQPCRRRPGTRSQSFQVLPRSRLRYSLS